MTILATVLMSVTLVATFNKTVRLVLSLVGNEFITGGGQGSSHPMHLHGHHFHVVDISYGPYNGGNGTLQTRSSDIRCNDPRCSLPSWNGSSPTFTISDKTVRKDTIIVPGGGYVVLHFRSDNPGFWFLHCHFISHVLQGMAVAINEVESRHNPAPPGFPKCGGFSISQKQYYKSVPDSSSRREIAGHWSVLTLISLLFYSTCQ